MSKTTMDNKNSDTGTKQDHTEFWGFLNDIIVEPLLFAFVVVMLFSRIQAIISLTTENPTYSFWAVLEADVKMNLGLYIAFGVIFLIWVALKGVKHRSEVAEKEKLNNTLEKINTNISNLQQVIKDLPDKIAESIKSLKNEKNESK